MSRMTELEAEAAASRARLEDTIARIQDKLTVSGMVDEFIGQSAAPRLSGGQDLLLGFLRRHPLPVMIAAAGIGFMIHRMSAKQARKSISPDDPGLDEVDVPALNTGQTRIYDPDLPSRHPLADGADPKRIEA